jgi:DNA mismatch repair protein MutS2
VPGSSSALSVAARFGIPTAVIERAERALPEESRTFEALVAELSEARAEHQRRAAALEEERRVHRKAREDLERELEKLRRREEKQLSEEGARLTKQMRDARAELRAARREIRRATTEAAAEATRKKLDAIEKSTAAIAAERPPPAAPAGDSEAMGAPASLTVGDRVYVERLRAEAQIIEGPTRGEVRVAAGALKLWVPVAECRAPRPDVPAPRRAAPRRGRSPEPADETVDVRGMRAEDAIGCVESFLDRAYGASLGQVTIVHGIGEGALMHAVREHLAKHSAYARSHRPGTREEGGDRVTVVELR